VKKRGQIFPCKARKIVKVTAEIKENMSEKSFSLSAGGDISFYGIVD
jgi:hypothetical protein